jgi:hypothetical protein
MRKMRAIISSALVGMVIVFGMSSYSAPTAKDQLVDHTMGNIEFKITNNTGSEFKYCVNGGHNYISNGSTKSFSYSAGQDFYYIEGSNCGKQWFEVTSDMNGKDYKLTDLL